MINDAVKESGGDSGIGEITTKLDKFEKSPLGEISQMSSAQLGNFRSLLNNPSGFIMSTFIQKFAKGVGVFTLALVLMEAVKVSITGLTKPGRLLDIRFKRDIRNEIAAFESRKNQQSIRQGFSSIILTSTPYMRGSVGQAGQTTYSLNNVRTGNLPNNYGFDPMSIPSSGQELHTVADSFHGFRPSPHR
jgi:hypothetical protein